MAEHIHARVLRWIAEGRSSEVECRCKAWPESQDWQPLLSNTSEHLGTLIKEEWDDRYEFRLKPRTVKIGSREVEAPVGDLENRETVWCWDSDYCHPCEQLAARSVARDQLKFGLCFATHEACRAAHDAIHALLRGEA